MPTRAVELFAEQIIRPLEKDNGKARPIALLETLLKFASGVIQETIREQGGEGAAWNQYGNEPAGPETMLMIGNALMKAMPEKAFVSLDYSNAFGAASRAEMLEGTAEWVPA